VNSKVGDHSLVSLERRAGRVRRTLTLARVRAREGSGPNPAMDEESERLGSLKEFWGERAQSIVKIEGGDREVMPLKGS